jgi:hypothetical protein
MNAEGVAGARPLRLVALLLLAPTLAALILVTLLLLGVDPHLVFLPGHLVKGSLELLGLHVPNRVGVLTTFALWWFIVVVVWAGLRRLAKR